MNIASRLLLIALSISTFIFISSPTELHPVTSLSSNEILPQSEPGGL